VYESATFERIEAAGVEVRRVAMSRIPYHPVNLAALARIRRIVGFTRPQVIHAHSSIAGVVARVVGAATGVPVVYTPHALASARRYLAVERALGRLTSRFIAVSESEADHVRRLGLVPAERIAVIPNGISLEEPPASRDLRSELGLDSEAPLIGTICRLVPQKAPQAFVAVCARVAESRPDAHFLLVGSGVLEPEISKAAQRAGLASRWHHVPYLPDASSVLGQLDVFVLVSAFEGGPYTPLEAMRAGTPVVLSDVVGNRDVAEDGKSGILVPFGAVQQAADAVTRLLENNRHREAIVEAAKARLEQSFDIRAMARALTDLYGEVAAEGRRRRTRRLPQDKETTSVQYPDSTASQNSS
jgi:glycosyltransferase involved in cell wall biosynthesis